MLVGSRFSAGFRSGSAKNQTQSVYMDPDLALEPDLMDLKVFYKFIGLGRSYGPKFRYSLKLIGLGQL